ncbi:F-type conjugal transfer protein TrbF (plasmid) [Escherichia coli]
MTANKKRIRNSKIRKKLDGILSIVSGILTDIFDLFIVFLVAGIVLWAVMHVIFDVCIDSWMADPKLLNFQYMWNVLMKVIPFTLWALAAGFLVTFFSVPNVRINIRKYHDIPAETPYAPGEHIKGGQQ